MSNFENMRLEDLFHLYNIGKQCCSGSLDEMVVIMHKKYILIPEDERRYCLGDMDLKDYPLKQIFKEYNLEV